MKDIQQFNFKGNQFRGLTDEQGDPWFFGKDACDILNIDTNHLRDALDEDEITNLRNPEVWNQPGRAPLIISEPGLYKLIMRSRKPEAKEFQRWVTHEVLPSIRKHGAYATEATIDQILANPDFGIKLLTDLKEERAKRTEAENQVRELEPKAKALDDFTNVPDALLVREAAKLLSNAGTPIGEEELREWLSQHGWVYRHAGTWWAASERVKAGHLVMVESRSHGQHKDGSIFAFAPTVKITRKGLALLHRRLGERTLEAALDA
ncbi:phage antirepressor KilAC domain-containing protein [Bifidobacterium dentium]|uniref:phage antirepressor KilAC domain-containing protein n=1 Tax=Bifidobacterium dentium TaxID=1689 RepID=UPI001ADDDA27|nr:phage antirepressor KilAC domain-containing protein [Bifidobacterium dentium]